VLLAQVGVILPDLIGAVKGDGGIEIDAQGLAFGIVKRPAEAADVGIVHREADGAVIGLLRTGLGADVDEAGAEVAVFGVIAARHQRDLLDGAEGNAGLGVAGRGIDIGEAVDEHAGLVGRAAADGQIAVVGRDPGQFGEKGIDLADAGGVLELGIAHHHLGVGDLEVEFVALRPHHHFAPLQHRLPEGEIGPGDAVGGDHDLGEFLGRVAHQRGPDGDGADRDVDNDKLALEVGDGAEAGALDDYIDPGQGLSAGGILDRTADAAARLGLSAGKNEQQDQRKASPRSAQ